MKMLVLVVDVLVLTGDVGVDTGDKYEECAITRRSVYIHQIKCLYCHHALH